MEALHVDLRVPMPLPDGSMPPDYSLDDCDPILRPLYEILSHLDGERNLPYHSKSPSSSFFRFSALNSSREDNYHHLPQPLDTLPNDNFDYASIGRIALKRLSPPYPEQQLGSKSAGVLKLTDSLLKHCLSNLVPELLCSRNNNLNNTNSASLMLINNNTLNTNGILHPSLSPVHSAGASPNHHGNMNLSDPNILISVVGGASNSPVNIIHYSNFNNLNLGGSATPTQLNNNNNSLSCSIPLAVEQQDAHEFLRLLLDAVHERVKHNDPFKSSATHCINGDWMNISPTSPSSLDGRRRREPSPSLLSLPDAANKYANKFFRTREMRAWAMEEEFAAREQSAITNLFRGLQCSIVQCQRCGFESETFEPFYDLSVDVHGVKPHNEAAQGINRLLGGSSIQQQQQQFMMSNQNFQFAKYNNNNNNYGDAGNLTNREINSINNNKNTSLMYPHLTHPSSGNTNNTNNNNSTHEDTFHANQNQQPFNTSNRGPIPSSNSSRRVSAPVSSISLSDCIKNYLSVEEDFGVEINNGTKSFSYRCERCNCRVPANRRVAIVRPPPALLVHLKRFDHLGCKVNRPVNLDRILNGEGPNLKVPEDGGYLGGGVYRLVGLIEHIGDSEAHGHYIAYVRRRIKIMEAGSQAHEAGGGVAGGGGPQIKSTSVWYRCDDDNVDRVDETTVLSKCDKAYLCLYLRVTRDGYLHSRPSTSAEMLRSCMKPESNLLGQPTSSRQWNEFVNFVESWESNNHREANGPNTGFVLKYMDLKLSNLENHSQRR